MKRIPVFLGCLALLAAGCNKVQTVDVPTDDPVEEIPALKFNITANYDAETRAVKSDWAEGDKIYLAFGITFQDEVAGFPTNHGYVTLTYDGSAFSNPTFSDPAFAKALQNAPGGKLAAAYVSGGQTPQFQFEDQSTDYTSIYVLSVTNSDELGGYLLSASGVDYTISDNVLTANLSLTLEAGEGSNRYPVHFFLPSVSEENVSNYTLSCTEFYPDRFACFMYMSLSTEQPSVPRTGGTIISTLGDPIRGSYYDGGIEFVAMLNPAVNGVETDYTLIITDNQGTPADDSDDVIYTIPKTATLKAKKAFNLPELTAPRWSTTNVDGTRGSLNGHEWVLMADGKKWATKNMGSVVQIDDITFETNGTLTWWKGAQERTDEDFGKGWRVPTVMDWVGLIVNGNHTLSNKYVGSGVDPSNFRGLIVTVNEGLPMSGNSIFLPHGGYSDESTGQHYDSNSGYYWSSTLYDYTHPNVLYFDSDSNPNADLIQNLSIYCHMFVRPIVDETALHVDYNGFDDEKEW